MDNRMDVQRISWTPHCPLTILTVHFFWTCRAQNKMSFLIVVYVFLSLKILFEHILNIMEWKPRIALGRREKKKLGPRFQNIMKRKSSNAILPFYVDHLLLVPHPPPWAKCSEACRRWWPSRQKVTITRHAQQSWAPLMGSGRSGQGLTVRRMDEAQAAFHFIELLSQEKSVIRNLPTLSLKWNNTVERMGTLQSGSHTPLLPVSGCYN